MPRGDGRRRDHDSRLRFEAVFRQHHPQVLAYARRRAPQDAADVVSEVFLTAWRRLDDLPADALPWLLGVARRIIANARRAAARRPSVPIGDPATVADAGSSLIERVSVAEAFRRLSDLDREVLMLVAWDGLPAARAARVLGCSVPTFHVRLHRARTRLARALEGAEGRGKPSAMVQGDGE
jgi:RNA polymerase sigma-70 factor, ECF subfamily